MGTAQAMALTWGQVFQMGSQGKTQLKPQSQFSIVFGHLVSPRESKSTVSRFSLGRCSRFPIPRRGHELMMPEPECPPV